MTRRTGLVLLGCGALALVAGPMVVRAMVAGGGGAAVTAALQRDATQLQTVALGVRQQDPAATGPVAERALADAVSAHERVAVIGTTTDAQQRVVVDATVWASVNQGGFGGGSPSSAMACLRVVATPGSANGGFGARGTVAVESTFCPKGAPLGRSSYAPQAPQRLDQLMISVPAANVPPVDKPCYSGSTTCN